MGWDTSNIFGVWPGHKVIYLSISTNHNGTSTVPTKEHRKRLVYDNTYDYRNKDGNLRPIQISCFDQEKISSLDNIFTLSTKKYR